MNKMRLRFLSSFYTIDLEHYDLTFESISIGKVEIKNISFDLEKDQVIKLIEQVLEALKEDD